MKFFTCPYEPKMCGSTSSSLVAELGKIYSVQANTILYLQYSICYWTIRSNWTAGGKTAPNNTFLEIRGNKLQGVSLYVNNGKTPNLATNETTVGTFSSTTLTYKGDQILYVVAISNDANPFVSFSYRFYEVKTIVLPNCTQLQDYIVDNGTVKCIDIPIPPPIII
jgi:hypothetical protein